MKGLALSCFPQLMAAAIVPPGAPYVVLVERDPSVWNVAPRGRS